MSATPELPYDQLVEADHDWNLVGTTVIAGRASGASVDVRSDGGGLWSASLNNIRFLHRGHTLLWRAIRQICAGGVNPIMVYRRDMTFRPYDGAEYEDIPHSDTSSFDDGAGYYQPVISVLTYAAANLRATTLGLDLLNCGPLVGGESFSINHPNAGWRLYEIATVEYVDDRHVVVTFNPPLREAVPIGAEAEFDRPRCVMKLINAGAMDLNTTTYPFSLANVKFIEAFPS